MRFSFTTYQPGVEMSSVLSVISVQFAWVCAVPSLPMYAYSFAGRFATVVSPTTPWVSSLYSDSLPLDSKRQSLASRLAAVPLEL